MLVVAVMVQDAVLENVRSDRWVLYWILRSCNR